MKKIDFYNLRSRSFKRDPKLDKAMDILMSLAIDCRLHGLDLKLLIDNVNVSGPEYLVKEVLARYHARLEEAGE